MVEIPRKRPVTEVIADNLAYWMKQHATLKTQSALGAAAGVAQTTIGNYLNPTQRLQGAKGKPPSPKVVELELIADALGIGLWLLVRPMSAKEREYYQKMEEAYAIANDPKGRPEDLVKPPRGATPIGPPKERPEGQMLGGRSQLGDLDEIPPMKKKGKH